MSGTPSDASYEDIMALEQRCDHMAAEAMTHISVVTAQQAALAANSASAAGVVDQIDSIMEAIEGEHKLAVTSLLRHHKYSRKQLQLWQSVGAVTASQLLAAADLIDAVVTDEGNSDRLISAAITSQCVWPLMKRPPAHQSGADLIYCSIPSISVALRVVPEKVLSSTLW